MILVHSGNRVDEAHRAAPRFPPDREEHVRERLDVLFELLRPEAVVTSLSAGADLLLVEVAMARAVPVHAVLPFPSGRFRAVSVQEQGERWVRAYDAAMVSITAAGTAGSLVVLDLPPGDEAFLATNGALIERARALAPGRVLAVTVRARRDGDPSSITDDFVHKAERARLFVVEIDPLAE